MARKPQNTAAAKSEIIDFDFGKRTYQIDPMRKKVYRRFVEIETSKACEILSLWRSQHATV